MDIINITGISTGYNYITLLYFHCDFQLTTSTNLINIRHSECCIIPASGYTVTRVRSTGKTMVLLYLEYMYQFY